MSQRPGWRTFPHTADLGLFVYGSSKRRLFVNASKAMMSYLCENRARPLTRIPVALQAPTEEELLVGFLSQVKYLFERQGFVPVKYEPFMHLPRGAGMAKTCVIHLLGEQIPKDQIQYHLEIKNITYHMLKLEWLPRLKRWRTRLVLDL